MHYLKVDGPRKELIRELKQQITSTKESLSVDENRNDLGTVGLIKGTGLLNYSCRLPSVLHTGVYQMSAPSDALTTENYTKQLKLIARLI